MIDAERVDFVAVPTRERDRAEKFSETWDSGVCDGAAFEDPEGNGLLLHHRYGPYRDGTLP